MLIEAQVLFLVCSYVVEEPADGYWGIRYDNGSWNGMMHDVLTSVSILFQMLTNVYRYGSSNLCDIVCKIMIVSDP